MHIEGSSSLQNPVAANLNSTQSQAVESYNEEIKSLHMEIERLKAEKINISDLVYSSCGDKESIQTEEKVVEMDENRTQISHHIEPAEVVDSNTLVMPVQTLDNSTPKPEENLPESIMNPCNSTDGFPDGRNLSQQEEKPPSEDSGLHLNSENLGSEHVPENTVSFYDIISLSSRVEVGASLLWILWGDLVHRGSNARY